MTRLILIFVIIFLNAVLFAQAPDTMWTKTFGDSLTDVGYSVQQTSDGGYIITGTNYSHHGVWLLKTDADGDTLWTKTFGDRSVYNEGHSVQQTTDAGYIITGVTNMRDGNAEALHHSGEVLLIKTNVSGDTQWSKTFRLSQSGNDIGYSVQQTTDGGYILTGAIGRGLPEIYLPGYPYKGDLILIKTDINGDTLWTKIIGGSDTTHVFGDVGYSVQQTIDGGYVIAGSTDSFGANDIDIWLIKTDVNGDTLWTKTFGDGWDKGYSVQQTTDGGYIIAGTSSLIKTDLNGDTLWTKIIGGSDTTYVFGDVGYSVQQTTDGGYIVVGTSLLIKTDMNGDTLWTKTFEGTGHSVQQTSDGGYIIAGIKDGDVLLIKVAPDITSIEENSKTILSDYQLHQNYPNPFNPKTTIEFSLPQSNFVTLKIYNILGEEVATLVSERLNAGKYEYNWNASSLASGVYLYRIRMGVHVETKKMVLMR